VIFRLDWNKLSREAVERAIGNDKDHLGDEQSGDGGLTADGSPIPSKRSNGKSTEGIPLVKEDSCDTTTNNGTIDKPAVEGTIPRRVLIEKLCLILCITILLAISLLILFLVPIPQRPLSCQFLGDISSQKDFQMLNITCQNDTTTAPP